MKSVFVWWMTVWSMTLSSTTIAAVSAVSADLQRNDPRLREVVYDPQTVITIFAKRGITTHVLLDEQERVEFIGTGVGSDCSRADDAWCVIAPQGGTQLFVKPKGAAQGDNNIAIATNRRAYSLRFVLVADDDPRQAVYRLTFLYPQADEAPPLPPTTAAPPPPVTLWTEPPAAEIVSRRLRRAPDVVNGEYRIAIGKRSDDIVPALIFDDGRFTYFKFPNNREVPAVFYVGADGEETIVNARMEQDLLVADRVGERFYLRRGKAVVGVWNEAFDIDGIPPANGTTVPGVERVFKEGVLR